MSQAPSVAFAAIPEEAVAGHPAAPDAPEALERGSGAVAGAAADDASAGARDRHDHSVSLKGTTRGLEILIAGTPTTAALEARLTELLAEAPSFFAGCDARVAIDGALPGGALACLEQVAARFELRIVEIGPAAARRRRADVPRALRPEDVPAVRLAGGTGPVADEPVDAVPGERGSAGASAPVAASAPSASAPIAAAAPSASAPIAAAPGAAEPAAPAALAEVLPPGPRLVVGPVRSGVIVEHAGHLVVIGDVNPGAEVRAEGSIIVLGRLRGVAHAAIGAAGGFIIALSLQPQQLRIGRMVARAGDADRPGDGAEIAYATGETITVERFSGRLPSGLAASM
jgi:septum formation inhibitor MinC